MSDITMPETNGTKANGHLKWVAIAALIAVFAAAYVYLPVSDWLSAFQHWVCQYP